MSPGVLTKNRFFQYILLLLQLTIISVACESNLGSDELPGSVLNETLASDIVAPRDPTVTTPVKAETNTPVPKDIPISQPTLEVLLLPSPTSTTITNIPLVIQVDSTPACAQSVSRQKYEIITEIKQAGEFITQVVISSGRLFVLDTNENVLSVFDTTHPYEPEIITQIDLSEFQYGIGFTVTDDYLFTYHWVPPGQDALRIFSLEEFTNIHRVAEFTHAELRNNVSRIFPASDHVYVTLLGSDNMRFLNLRTFEIFDVVISLSKDGYAESYVDPIIETENYVFALNSLSEPFKSPKHRLVIFEKNTATHWLAVNILEMPENIEYVEHDDSLPAWIHSNRWSDPVADELLAFDIMHPDTHLIDRVALSQILQSNITTVAILDTVVYVTTTSGKLFIIEMEPDC